MRSAKAKTSGEIAVIESSGKQVIVSVGEIVKVPLLDANAGDTVDLSDMVTGKAVVALVVEHGRYPKVTGRLFKNKIRASRYPRGHRQDFTSLQITAIK